MGVEIKNVVIVQYRLLHYRVEFFEQLRAACSAAGIELTLVHGDPTPSEVVRNDTGELPWASQIHNRSWRLGGRDVLWQPFSRMVKHADLVVLMQESRLLSNYPWLFGLGPRRTRVAFWGHGRNFQSTAPKGVREWWKRRLVTSADWWFAYTDISADIVRQAGFPRERITVLNNAIDNRRFEADLASVSVSDIAALRTSIGADADAVVGLYCGSLYGDKRLDVMIEACARVVASRPDFRLVVVGDGPSRSDLGPVMDKPWFHWAGVQRGRGKAAWFKAAQLFLNPGAVGLQVLDSFVAGVPLITTKDARHGPEVAYLQDGVNGIITEGSVDAYAAAVQRMVDDEELRASIASQARLNAATLTLESMVDNFVAGIDACLRMPRLR